MQGRGLLIAVGVLALLSGALWWTNKNPEDPSKKEGAGKQEALVTLTQADLVEVTVTRKGETPLVLRKNAASGNWEMVLEPALPTSGPEALDVVNNAATVMSEQVVDDNATDLIQYGLDPAQLTLKLKDKAGKTQELLVGDQAPVGLKFYVRRPNEKKVYAIAQNYKLGFDKTVNDLRDKRLLIFDEVKLAKLEVLSKASALEFGKNAQGIWQLVKPQPFRTDAVVVDELLNKVKEAKFDPAVDAETAKKNAAGFAAAAVVGTVKVTDAGGTRTLEVRKSKDNEFLAKSSAVDGVHKVGEELGKGFDKSLDDYRSKKLMDFGFADPAKVVVETGGKTSVLEHKGEDWIWNGKKADASTVTAFLEGLRGFAALNFVEKKFTTAAFTVTVTLADGKTVEKLMVAKVGNYQYAQRAGETGEYELDPKTLTDLEAAMGKIREAGAAKK